MNPSAAPQTKAAVVQELLNGLFDLECTAEEFDPFTLRRIRRLIDELATEDRRAADIHLSSLQTILNDYEGGKAAAENLLANNFRGSYLSAHAKLESNFLFATAAHRWLKEMAEFGEECYIAGFFELCIAVGAFRLASHVVDQANAQNRVMVNPTVAVPLARAVVPVLDHFGITDDEVAACIEEAGKLLRERRLLWLRNQPEVLVAGLDSDDPGVSVEYAIAVTPEQAAELNNRLADALIEKDLFKPGFTLGFTGVRS